MFHKLAKYTNRVRIVAFFLVATSMAYSGCGKKEADAAETLVSANQLLDQGAVGQAITLLDTYNAQYPNNAGIIEALAFAHSRNRDHLMAAIYFLDLSQQLPDQPEHILYAAEALATAGDWIGATEHYRSYLQRRPQDAAIWIQLGIAQEQQGLSAMAIDSFLKAYNLAKDARIALRLARLYATQKMAAQARTWYLNAAADPSLTAEALLGQLELEMANGRYREADTIALRLNKEYPGMLELSPMAALLDQLTEWKTKEGEEETRRKEAAAEERRRKAAEARAAAMASINERALADQQTGPVAISTAISADGVLTTAERATEPATNPPPAPPAPPPPPPIEVAPPSYADQLALDADKATQEGNYERAVTLYRRSLAEEATHPSRWSALAITSLLAGDAQLALASILEARRRSPEDSAILLDYFAIIEQALPPQTYFDELEAAYQRDTSNADLTLRLARAYNYLVHNRGSARILYNEFLRLAPDHPEASFARAELQDL